MKRPRSGELGSKVCRCCGVSRVCLAQFHAARNWLRCWRQIVPLRIWICNSATSVSKASRPNGWIFLMVVPERLSEPASKTVDVCRCGRWCLNTFKRVWRVGRIHFALRDCSTRNVFLETSMYSKCFEINLFEFKLPQYSCHQDSTLNAFHGGQVLATALKSNKTVVDINLARNERCCDEGAEACEPIWDELTTGGVDLPDTDWHWQRLTLTHFFELEWMDVVSLFLRVTSEARMFALWSDGTFFFAGNGRGPQHKRSHQAFELGVLWNPWCWGGGQVVVMCLYLSHVVNYRVLSHDLRLHAQGVLKVLAEKR